MIPRVLYLITDSGVGGTEKVLHQLLLRLSRNAFDPCGVVVLKNKREMAAAWEKTGVPVQSLGLKRWPSPALLWRLRNIMRQKNPQIVHAFLYHSIQVARIARIFDSSFQLVSSPRVNYRFASKLAVAFDRLMKSFDDNVVCESEAGRRTLIENLGYAPQKTTVAWNSVDGGTYRFDSVERARVRREWRLEDEEILIGSVGRLHYQKGFDVFLNALDHVRRGSIKFKGVIVGAGPDWPQLNQIVFARNLPVFLAGERTDVSAILSALDLYVQSSRYEGLSNSLLEAMSCGRPCVATAVDGTLDFAKDGDNMILARPEDDVSLAAAIQLLLEKPSLRNKLSENATITAREFSVERMIRGFEEAYRSVLTKSQGKSTDVRSIF